MTDLELSGRLVYLTTHTDVWLREINPKFNIFMVNRIAKIVKVFDWNSEEGKILLAERKKNGKWGAKLNPRDFKFVLKVYCPELSLKKKRGVTVDELLPLHFPGTKLTMFEPIPSWMLKDLQKEEKDIFKIIRKQEENSNPDSNKKTVKKSNVSRRVRKKSQ
jgi:hypothetical protein